MSQLNSTGSRLIGNAPGDIAQWDGSEWTPVPVSSIIPPAVPARSFFHWGSLFINTGSQPVFMYPGYSDTLAITQRFQITWTFDCVFSQMRVRARVAGTGGNSLIYRLDRNAADSGLEVTMLNTATTGSNLVDTAAVSAGDTLSLRVAKQGGPITTSPTNIVVSFMIEANP